MAESDQALNDHRGMWLVWFDGSQADGRVAWSKLVQASEEKELELCEKDAKKVVQPFGIITRDDRDVGDIYKQGKKIREVLGKFSYESKMYYKMKGAVQQGSGTRKGEERICKYTLGHGGSLQVRNPYDDQWFDVDIGVLEEKD